MPLPDSSDEDGLRKDPLRIIRQGDVRGKGDVEVGGLGGRGEGGEGKEVEVKILGADCLDRRDRNL